MKKEHAKVLRKLFSDAVNTHMQDYIIFNEKSPYINPGNVVFVSQLHEGISLFIELCIAPGDHQSFSIALAWSTENRYPQLGCFPNLFYDNAHEHFDDREGAVFIVNPEVGNDSTWMLDKLYTLEQIEQHSQYATLADFTKRPTPEESLHKVLPVFDAAFSALLLAAPSFFKRILTHKQIA